MPFGLFARNLKSELNCPVCQFSFSHSISRRDLDAIDFEKYNIAIIDEHDCPFCRHHFYIIATDKNTLITQERDWNQKIEQLEERLEVIYEMLGDSEQRLDKQRIAQLNLHAEVTRKRVQDMEKEFEAHCLNWHKRMLEAQLK